MCAKDLLSDPEIHGGQSVVETGTPIYLILAMLAQGFPADEMRRDYGVTDEHMRVALRFAAQRWHSFPRPTVLNDHLRRGLAAAKQSSVACAPGTPEGVWQALRPCPPVRSGRRR
ncbi:MAG: DUF433 domain-containing protein [Ktedonobacterales bacterium]